MTGPSQAGRTEEGSGRPADGLHGGRHGTHFVLGGGRVGATVAERLQADGHAVTVVDETHDHGDVLTVEGTPADLDVLAASGLEGAASAVVGTRSDPRNVLIAQLLRVHFDVPRVIVLVRDPERRSSLVAAGHEPLCVTTALSESVGERV